MLNLVILSGLLVAVLGMRLTILSLVPAVSVIFAAVPGIGVMLGASFGDIIQTAVLSILCLQIGYLAGSFTRVMIASARVSRLRHFRKSRAGFDPYGSPSSRA